MTWVKRIWFFGIILIGLYISFVAFMVLRPDILDYFDRSEFERSAWIKWEDNEFTQKLRWNMIDDLTKNYELIGKTKEEIIKLLGEPESEYDNEISYYLGLTGHGINTGSLLFSFENGIVISYRVRQG